VSVKTRVLDSWAILEWIAGQQPAFGVVAALLSGAEENRARLLMSVINAGEVYYCLRKNHSLGLAESWRESSPTMPITFEVPTAPEVWNAAGIKAEFPIAYADAFAAALSLKYACPLMTGDPEFRKVDRLELDWIGRNETA
jgi:predicted nucleic acid-binding protein